MEHADERELALLKERAEDILYQSEKARLIDFEERNRRMDILETTYTPQEIEPLIKDLRPASSSRPFSNPSGSSQPASGADSSDRASFRETSRSPEAKEKEQQISTILGESKRRGGWLESKQVRLFNLLGETQLDLREEDLSGEPLVIDVNVILGELKLRIPREAILQSNVSAVLGETNIASSIKSRDDGKSPLVIIQGSVLLGAVTVRR